jgi:hypothetical protein
MVIIEPFSLLSLQPEASCSQAPDRTRGGYYKDSLDKMKDRSSAALFSCLFLFIFAKRMSLVCVLNAKVEVCPQAVLRSHQARMADGGLSL